jgi:hypothetical protein
MKTIAFLMTVLVLGPLGAMGQSDIVFADQGSGQLISIIPDPSNPVTVLIGGNVAASAAVGAGPGQVIFRLYVQSNGIPLEFNVDGRTPLNMFLVGTTTNEGSTLSIAAGVFNGGDPYILSTPWDGTFPVEFYYTATTSNGFYFGHSTLGTNYTPTTGSTPVVNTFGPGPNQVLGFTLMLVPEPSTTMLLLLGGLGVAGLWSFRRFRKRSASSPCRPT